jgi:hypothetical protein
MPDLEKMAGPRQLGRKVPTRESRSGACTAKRKERFTRTGSGKGNDLLGGASLSNGQIRLVVLARRRNLLDRGKKKEDDDARVAQAVVIAVERASSLSRVH